MNENEVILICTPTINLVFAFLFLNIANIFFSNQLEVDKISRATLTVNMRIEEAIAVKNKLYREQIILRSQFRKNPLVNYCDESLSIKFKNYFITDIFATLRLKVTQLRIFFAYMNVYSL